MINRYADSFYKNRHKNTIYAAHKILKCVFDILPSSKSIVDIGCGVGTWLYVAKKYFNVQKVTGYDGEYVPRKYLKINQEDFFPSNLEKMLFPCDKQYDLAICLEVVEHIKPVYADSLVHNLCGLSHVVLFSAAILYQGGTNHVNEQRLSYWEEKFKKEGYLLADIIRPLIWEDENIPVWYRQNTVIFSDLNIINRKENIKKDSFVDIVHPDLFERHMEELKAKYIRVNEMMQQWTLLAIKNISIARWLQEENYRRIIVCGKGSLKNILIEDLKNKKICIKKIINDADVDNINREISNIAKEVDLIIITSIDNCERDYELIECNKCKIISLERIIADLFYKYIR